MPNLPTCRKNLNKALDAYAAELEELARLALMRLAARYPKKRCGFCSAMGGWDWYLDGEPVLPIRREIRSAANQFTEAFSDFGYPVIPAIRMEIKDGKFTRLTDW